MCLCSSFVSLLLSSKCFLLIILVKTLGSCVFIAFVFSFSLGIFQLPCCVLWKFKLLAVCMFTFNGEFWNVVLWHIPSQEVEQRVFLCSLICIKTWLKSHLFGLSYCIYSKHVGPYPKVAVRSDDSYLWKSGLYSGTRNGLTFVEG